MRYSELLIPTVREDPSDAEVASHRLMIRAGLIRQVAAGIYALLPLGLRVIRKVERILREELDRAGAQEVFLPAVQPAELWQESGRWKIYGKELLRFRDRKDREFCFGPTHEEVITDLVRRDVRSYRDLPLNLYQIQTKFRDEARPRFGLMRGREFSMKDGYSFDVDDEGARRSYRAMYDAYTRIFRRAGLRFRAVEADTGAIGGSDSHEFMVLAESGEDEIAFCDRCDYAANVERVELARAPAASTDASGAVAEVATPGARTIEEVTQYLGVPAERLAKTLVCDVDGELVAALVRGDHDLNEMALKRVLGADAVELADDARVREATRAPVGYAGPVGLALRVVVDEALEGARNLVVGGNREGVHLTGVEPGRDFAVERYASIRRAVAGDACVKCGQGTLGFQRGIEVGHVFRLGTKYSDAMGARFLDSQGRSQAMVMGSYGIGVGRTAAAAVEQNHDERGIRWPVALAPFEVAVVALATTEPVVARARELHDAFAAAGVEVLLDDREERAGVKFKDAELIGFPYAVVVGARGLERGVVEVRTRATGAQREVAIADVVAEVAADVAVAKAAPA